MSITAFAGPVVQFGQNPVAGSEYNPERGPALFDQGMALLDPRLPFTFMPGQGFGNQTSGWLNGGFATIDAAPSTAAAANVAASQTPVAGTALTLVSVTGSGVTAGVSIVRADTQAIVTGLLALDGAMGTVAFGSAGTVQLWDPTKAIARTIRIVSASNDSTATFTVRGYDLYGYPMTETITGGNTTTVKGKKAWKYIASITPAGTLGGGAVTVGTNDVFGFALRSDATYQSFMFWNSTFGTTANGFTAAVSTTASATTGDVRGTIDITNASGFNSAADGTKRLQVIAFPAVANISSTAGILGVTQF